VKWIIKKVGTAALFCPAVVAILSRQVVSI